MGRILRRVPENWEHPKRDNGNHKPMFNEYYGDVLAQWIKEHNEWEAGTHPDLINRSELKEKYPFYSMWHGNAPDVEYYQTIKYTDAQLTHIQLYEDTSEGTPITPVFKADELEKLCEYAAENATVFGDIKVSKERWLEMLSDGFVMHKEGNAIFI